VRASEVKMPLTIRLETEKGLPVAEVFDLRDALTSRIEALLRGGIELELGRFINRYGNTVFNKLQLIDFLPEVDRVLVAAEGTEDHASLSEISHLVSRGADGEDLYLKFIGD
jgi:hypothetical protein